MTISAFLFYLKYLLPLFDALNHAKKVHLKTNKVKGKNRYGPAPFAILIILSDTPFGVNRALNSIIFVSCPNIIADFDVHVHRPVAGRSISRLNHPSTLKGANQQGLPCFVCSARRSRMCSCFEFFVIRIDSPPMFMPGRYLTGVCERGERTVIF